jgi:hypothetical protein
MPVAAQGYCAHWVDTLHDTSDSCVNEPWRERAMGIQNLRWKGHEYVILNRGNELSFYKIDNPTDPGHVPTSSFRFGTRGDSDYDLLDFDVCDDCRYGIFAHKVAGHRRRAVVFTALRDARDRFICGRLHLPEGRAAVSPHVNVGE